METVVIARNQKPHRNTFIATALGTVVLLVMFFFTYSSSVPGLETSMVMYGIMAPVALVGAIISGRALQNKSPALELTNEGLVDNISLVKPGLIRWQHIHSTKLKKVQGQELLVVYLHSDGAELDLPSRAAQLRAASMLKKVDSPIAIPVKFVELEGEALKALIDGRL